MFKITSDIEIGNYKAVKPSALAWTKSIDNFSDSCTIKLPAIAMLKREGDVYEQVQTGQQFKEGMPVAVYVGYDGNNDLHFKGFIRRINFTVPLEIECEGYSYQLRKKTNYNKKIIAGMKLKAVLSDLIQGTDIVLSPNIPDVAIDSNHQFNNFRGIDVLDWIKDKMLLTVYFDNEKLYVGLQQAVVAGTVKYRLGWNVIKDNELKFNTDKEFAKVNFILDQPRAKDGTYKKGIKDSKYTDEYRTKIGVRFPKAFLDQLADDLKNKLVNRGYEGAITTFLKPFAKPSMAAAIDDKKYPERAGRYFITGVEGKMDSGGGRLKIKIGNAL